MSATAGGTVFVQTSDDGLPTVHVRGESARASTLLVEFSAGEYPLHSHCVYARHTDASGPRVFSRIEWAEAEPGIRVGPWPGWRGIPDMPGVFLIGEGVRTAGRWLFWGDELVTGQLRAAFRLEAGMEGVFEIECEDSRIRVRRCEPVDIAVQMAQPSKLSLREELTGRHPRLLVTPDDLPGLREAARRGSPSWRRFMMALAASTGAEYSNEAKIPPGPEGLTPVDHMLLAAVAALADPSDDRIREAVAALDRCLVLADDPAYGPLSIDTQCGEFLFLLCVAFDWLHPWLDKPRHADAEARLAGIALRCESYLTPERRDYAQAHFLGCGLGLLAHSLLQDSDDGAVRDRLAYLHGAFVSVLEMLPADGFYPHGINLWIYEHGFLLRWLELLRGSCGVDYWNATEYWSHASDFRAATLSSDSRIGVTFGDAQYRVGGDAWMHDLIALRRGSRPAAELALRLRDGGVDGVDFRCAPPRRRVYELLYAREDADAPARGVSLQDDAPAIFRDGGQVSIRRGGALLALRCGAPLGRSRRRGGEPGGYGHSDPCNGSVLLERDGELVLAGPGPVYRRDTALQNVFTVQGSGQYGDGAVWCPDLLTESAIPDEPILYSPGLFHCITADSTRAYLPFLGVASCLRALAMAPDGSILGVDRIRLNRQGRIEWNLHSWGRFIHRSLVPLLAFDIRCGASSSLLQILPGGPFRFTLGSDEYVPAYPNDGRPSAVLRLSSDVAAMSVVWSLGPEDTGMLECTAVHPGLLRIGTGNLSLYFHTPSNQFSLNVEKE